MKKSARVGLMSLLLLITGCQASVEKYVSDSRENQGLSNIEVAISESNLRLMGNDYSNLKTLHKNFKYPVSWYMYSLDGSAGSTLYFTDGGDIDKNLNSNAIIGQNPAANTMINECLFSFNYQCWDGGYKIVSAVNNKINLEDRKECDVILSYLKQQVPEREEDVYQLSLHQKQLQKDIATFIDLGQNYYKDPKSKIIYFQGFFACGFDIQEVKGADYDSFTVISNENLNESQEKKARDKNFIYLDGQPEK